MKKIIASLMLPFFIASCVNAGSETNRGNLSYNVLDSVNLPPARRQSATLQPTKIIPNNEFNNEEKIISITKELCKKSSNLIISASRMTIEDVRKKLDEFSNSEFTTDSEVWYVNVEGDIVWPFLDEQSQSRMSDAEYKTVYNGKKMSLIISPENGMVIYGILHKPKS